MGVMALKQLKSSSLLVNDSNILLPMPDVFDRPVADCRGSAGARDAESLLNPGVKTVEILAERALID